MEKKIILSRRNISSHKFDTKQYGIVYDLFLPATKRSFE
jgi:hypothetical protein